jgi:predicted HAD superfamily phosphohydrolase YqeG
MFLNISKPIKRKVTFIDSNNIKKTINTSLSNLDIKYYFNAKKIIQ